MYPVLEKFILIIGLIISLGFLLELLLHWKRRHFLRSLKSIPTVKHTFPILGHIRIALEGPKKLLQNLEKAADEKRGNSKGWAFHREYVLMSNAEDIALTLGGSNCLNKSIDYSILHESIMKQGLFSSTNLAEWRKNRKLTTPAFNFQVLKSFISYFYIDANILANTLIRVMEKDGEVEVCEPIGLCTLDMIARNAVGVTLNSQGDRGHIFARSLEILLNIWHERVCKPWYLNTFIFGLSSMKSKHDKAMHDAELFASEVILSKLEERLRKSINLEDPHGNNLNSDNKTDDDCGRREPKAFLDLFIEYGYDGVDEYCLRKSIEQLRETISLSKSKSNKYNNSNGCATKSGINIKPEFKQLQASKHGAKDGITSEDNIEASNTEVRLKIAELQHLNRQLRDEVCAILVAGHETTATVTSFAVLMLAMHQEVQSKVFDELDKIFGEDRRSPSYEDLQKMEYLECVIKETLRLYPSLPFVLRAVEKDTALSDKSVIPKGCTIIYSIYGLHRSPSYFSDPEKFIPERFLPGKSRDRHPYSFIPFGAGARNCIAKRYAMLEMKVILSTLVREFNLLPSERMPTMDHVHLEVGVTLHPQAGCWVKLQKRHSNGVAVEPERKS